LYLPQATRHQIIEAVDTINRHRSVRPGGYGPNVEFLVNEDGFAKVTRNSALEGTQIADDVVRLRHLLTTVSADVITWHRGHDDPTGTLDLQEVDTPVPATFTAIRRDLGTERVAVTLRPAHDTLPPWDDTATAPTWTVSFPFTREQEIHVEAQLASLPVPKIQWVTIGDNGTITGLSVTVNGSVAAPGQLAAVVTTLGASHDRPLELAWRTVGHGYGDATATSGVVTIGACHYPIGRDRDDPGNQLQTLLRKQFDTCTR
jgi:hypothetical protein